MNTTEHTSTNAMLSKSRFPTYSFSVLPSRIIAPPLDMQNKNLIQTTLKQIRRDDSSIGSNSHKPGMRKFSETDDKLFSVKNKK